MRFSGSLLVPQVGDSTADSEGWWRQLSRNKSSSRDWRSSGCAHIAQGDQSRWQVAHVFPAPGIPARAAGSPSTGWQLHWRAYAGVQQHFHIIMSNARGALADPALSLQPLHRPRGCRVHACILAAVREQRPSVFARCACMLSESLSHRPAGVAQLQRPQPGPGQRAQRRRQPQRAAQRAGAPAAAAAAAGQRPAQGEEQRVCGAPAGQRAAGWPPPLHQNPGDQLGCGAVLSQSPLGCRHGMQALHGLHACMLMLRSCTSFRLQMLHVSACETQSACQALQSVLQILSNSA